MPSYYSIGTPSHFPSPSHFSAVVAIIAVILIVQCPMAVTGRNGSLEMMLHRRLVKKMVIRGDDSTVLNDSVLIGGFVDKVGGAKWASMNFM